MLSVYNTTSTRLIDDCFRKNEMEIIEVKGQPLSGRTLDPGNYRQPGNQMNLVQFEATPRRPTGRLVETCSHLCQSVRLLE